MAKWVLYHTDGCHLCEQAEQLITEVLSDTSELLLIDIMTDEQLIAEYQISIPVLKSEHGEQFFWPFTSHSVREFLAQTE
ncbi:glutaredoxin family protein [Pseudoalteromonas sp. SG45-5]|uniref:glutaredoxin family protein n=1 Tax=unclassified Pseudoalteromonas TaxID=194690 RepID=UPI0015F8F900|nr:MULTISPECIES: glutaredoxin family protein [unclassified Pseudoalteromonas]MBB1386292.1 glutaredoxin family protein [Pseudoalteromonas sp. SG45-5]MBB1394337.1 glutaredoxin family protein [Pseudoalteromonas sp. SG44-4]MBB1447669.1 glutaredoxin family protein [Pseudoalteromonas sp. SG41-6]